MRRGELTILKAFSERLGAWKVKLTVRTAKMCKKRSA